MKPNEKLLGGLEIAFFGLAFLALVVGLVGSPGWGLLLLILAGAAFAVRAAMEEARLVPADGRSRALPILRRGAELTLRGAGQGAAAAHRGARAAREQVEAARRTRSAR
jgi:hypothetical protein